jgi:hypothetical protein
MPTTYPPAAPTISGQLITVDRLVNSPVLIYRILRTLVQQRLVGDKALSGRVDLTGSGTAVYEIAESIFADMPAEIVAALAEYPLTTDTPGTIAVASTAKWGLADMISDEMVARNRIDLAMRKLIKLANRIVFQFDALALSAISSAVTQTQAAVAAWNVSTADPLADILAAAAIIDTLNQGYVADTVLTTPTKWANVVSHAKILDRAPREGNNNLVLTGNLVQIAGLDIWKTTNMPAGVSAVVLDSSMLGSIAYEALGGGYQGSAGDVESKRIRLDENDGWKIQARKVAVPMVQEPGAAVKITGV